MLIFYFFKMRIFLIVIETLNLALFETVAVLQNETIIHRTS